MQDLLLNAVDETTPANRVIRIKEYARNRFMLQKYEILM